MALGLSTSRVPLAPALRSYFRSGWAFLIPYLAAYLLYWRLNWPVNPRSAPGLQPPCLLHVYWALHAINVILGAIALVSWWRRQSAEDSPERLRPKALGSALRGVAPWLLVALVFWVPGVYLEWPADPWEHFRRINEWSSLQTVVAHYAWTKTSYFLAYSLLGQIAPVARRLFWLDLYYTGVCLLLSWQYFRLARAAGLSAPASALFVLLLTVLLGNSVFGFYRYYGISSTMFAQIGAIAFIRVGLEAVGRPRLGTGSTGPGLSLSPLSLVASGAGAGVAPGLPAFSSLLRGSVAAAALLPLIAFNHVQGLGVAGLGLGAVLVWRLIEWRRSMILWLAMATVALSVAAVLWWPRSPALDDPYRSSGWLTAWYGFNVLAPHSLAGDRAIVILGAFGIINLVAGLFLLRRNHVAGWLAVTPLLALCLPFVAIPFANALAQIALSEIIDFHRMLLTIPAGLALVAMGCALAENAPRGGRTIAKAGSTSWLPLVGPAARRATTDPFLLLILTLVALVVVPADQPFYNRFWHALMIPPRDLVMEDTALAVEPVADRLRGVKHARLVAAPAIASVLNSISPRQFPYRERLIGQPMAGYLGHAVAVVRSSRPTLDRRNPTLTDDPAAADPAAWRTLAGSPPEFVAGVTDFRGCSTALQNAAGRSCDVFTSALIPIDPAATYRVEWSAMQRLGTDATAYLAVAWYDERGRLLVAAAPAPAGGGNPAGWTNGTYSYFGIAGATAPIAWTTYRTSFGPGGEAAIASGAAFVRVGALLNYNLTPAAIIQLTNIRLWRRSATEMIADGVFAGDEHLWVVAPPGCTQWTPASQAAQLSRHWPAQQVAVDFGGSPELAAAARAAGGAPVDSCGVVLELGGKVSASAPGS